jgi:hypothetical protein
MHDKVESASLSIEVALTSIGSVRKTAVDITALQTEKGNALSVFQDKNVWICDMGASKHVTKNLQVWGEALVVSVGKDSKTGDKGTHMMFVCWAWQAQKQHHMYVGSKHHESHSD